LDRIFKIPHNLDSSCAPLSFISRPLATTFVTGIAPAYSIAYRIPHQGATAARARLSMDLCYICTTALFAGIAPAYSIAYRIPYRGATAARAPVVCAGQLCQEITSAAVNDLLAIFCRAISRGVPLVLVACSLYSWLAVFLLSLLSFLIFLQETTVASSSVVSSWHGVVS
jgi:hypothetical protein